MVREVMGNKIYESIEEMFDSIRGADGVLKPSQFVSDGRTFIRLSDLQDSLETCTQHPSSRSDNQPFVK